MDYNTRLLLFGIIMIAATAGIATVLSSFQFVADPNGYFHIAARPELARTNTCYDTDGGTNWFVQGATRYLNWSFMDACTTTVTATGNISVLYEGYCIDSTKAAIIQQFCINGCSNGACLR